MPVRFRRDLAQALEGFVESHRGLRITRTFGMPSAYAGRRMFACVHADGVACRLSADAARRELKRGAIPFAAALGRGAASRSRSGWVFYRLARGGFGREIARVLEESARFTAGVSLPEPPA